MLNNGYLDYDIQLPINYVIAHKLVVAVITIHKHNRHMLNVQQKVCYNFLDFNVDKFLFALFVMKPENNNNNNNEEFHCKPFK